MWCDHPFSERNKTAERTVGLGVGGDRQVGGGGGSNLEKGGWQYKGVLHQTGGLARLYHLRKETLKISHSLHY